MVGDFNLHHPLWSKPWYPPHDQADELLEITQQLDLLTPHGSETFPTTHGGTTIDLVFSSPGLTDRLLECAVATDREHGSDYMAVRSRWNIEPVATVERRYRNWKLTDTAQAEQMALYLPKYNTEQHTIEGLEVYTIELTLRIQGIIDATTLWKRSSERTERWWIPEVDIAVRVVRSARWQWLAERENEQLKLQVGLLQKEKKRTIYRAKQATWR
jgi:hypothetical protein